MRQQRDMGRGLSLVPERENESWLVAGFGAEKSSAYVGDCMPCDAVTGLRDVADQIGCPVVCAAKQACRAREDTFHAVLKLARSQWQSAFKAASLRLSALPSRTYASLNAFFPIICFSTPQIPAAPVLLIRAIYRCLNQ